MVAREMFEKLGYGFKKIFYEDDSNYAYEYSCGGKRFTFQDIDEKGIVTDSVNYISSDELQAIIQQCKELGWLEDEKQAIKQEYIEALERMKQVDFDFDGCISTMNKFKECVNLLTRLVNEHFEEEKQGIKQETNYEHYKDGIIEMCLEDLAISKEKISNCNATSCSECVFVDKDGRCIGCNEIKKWLKQPYKKQPYKLSQFEFDLIQTYRDGNTDCKLSDRRILRELKDKGYFKCVDYDTNIKDILANCEVVG